MSKLAEALSRAAQVKAHVSSHRSDTCGNLSADVKVLLDGLAEASQLIDTLLIQNGGPISSLEQECEYGGDVPEDVTPDYVMVRRVDIDALAAAVRYGE